MNILLITSEYGSEAGGLSYACWNYANLLKDLGHSVSIVSSVGNFFSSDSNNDLKSISSNIRIETGGYKTELHKQLFFKAHLFETYEELKTELFDLVISFGAGENGFFASELSTRLSTSLVLLLRGSEINLSISDMELRQKNYIALSRANAVIGLSNELIKNSQDIYYNPGVKYEVIPIIIKAPTKIKIDFCPDKIVLGCGAHHLNEKKGIANLITSIAELKGLTSAKISLEFIGRIDDDLLENYKKLIKELGLKQQVKLLGGLSRDEFLKRMKSWDFYIQTSFGEGFSNSVAEYLSLGKAFILSKTGFIAETLHDNFQSLILDSFDPTKISHKILQLIQKKDIELYFKEAYDAILSKTNEAEIKNKWETVICRIYNKPLKQIEKNNILSVVFHDISLNESSNIDVSIAAFESFVDLIYQSDYALCSSSDFFKSQDKSNLIICTFDDGYENLQKYALPILNKYNFTATVFLCFNYIGNNNNWNLKDTKRRMHLSEPQLKELQENGWEIGSHGLSHNSLLKLTDNELFDELLISKNKLENVFGRIEAYAYPYGDFNEYLKSKVKENYSVAYSLTKGGTLLGIDNHQIRRYFLSEFNTLLKK